MSLNLNEWVEEHKVTNTTGHGDSDEFIYLSDFYWLMKKLDNHRNVEEIIADLKIPLEYKKK